MVIEWEWYVVERDLWYKEMWVVMVLKEEEKVLNKWKVLDLDVGYYKEFEVVNKRLEMDNRLMVFRVCLVSYLMVRVDFFLVGWYLKINWLIC